jgi:hypothetical protein
MLPANNIRMGIFQKQTGFLLWFAERDKFFKPEGYYKKNPAFSGIKL